jgi:hypothetical protein
MAITKIVETQITTPTSVGAATSINSATCVRLFNNVGAAVTVSISTAVGAGTTLSFGLPQNAVEFLQKQPTDVIYTSAGILANKVAFTN